MVGRIGPINQNFQYKIANASPADTEPAANAAGNNRAPANNGADRLGNLRNDFGANGIIGKKSQQTGIKDCKT